MTAIILILLSVQIALLWFLLRPKRDWYVVEHQVSYGKAAPSSTDGAFTNLTVTAHGLTIEMVEGNTATLSGKDGAKILIYQEVFSDLAAANRYFDSLKKLLTYGDDDAYDKFYLRRVIARSREGAIALPPEPVSGIVLEWSSSRRKPIE